MTDEIIIDGTTKGHATYRAIETIVKGPEIDLGGLVYLDKGGHRRNKARRRWWDESARTLRDIAEIPVALVVETDDYDALVEGLRPIIPSGTATIQPVGDMAAQVAKRMADNG